MKIDERKEEIIDLYTSSGLTTVEIAKIIGCSSSGVGRLLERNGISRIHTPNEIRISSDEEQEICRRYLNGETTAEICSSYSLCDASIAKVLRRNNIEVRRAVRRSPVQRHDYFHNIDTAEKAYFLGWMISDGCVVESKARKDRSRIISIEIHNRDKYILEAFAEEIGATPDIVKCFEKRGHCHLRFASEQMANDLEKYGVVVRKSWVTRLPYLNEIFMSHLIRGIFDGNGTVTYDDSYVKFAFYGSEQLCTEVRNFLASKIGLRMNKVSKSTCYHVWWSGKEQAERFTKFLYKDAGDFKLKRKYDRFSNYICHGNTEITS